MKMEIIQAQPVKLIDFHYTDIDVFHGQAKTEHGKNNIVNYQK